MVARIWVLAVRMVFGFIGLPSVCLGGVCWICCGLWVFVLLLYLCLFELFWVMVWIGGFGYLICRGTVFIAFHWLSVLFVAADVLLVTLIVGCFKFIRLLLLLTLDVKTVFDCLSEYLYLLCCTVLI